MHPTTWRAAFLASTSVLVLAACQNWGSGDVVRPPLTVPDAQTTEPDTAPPPPPPDLSAMPGVGDTCDDLLLKCRDGLACIDGECLAIGTSTAGTTCLLSDECTDGLVCGLEVAARKKARRSPASFAYGPMDAPRTTCAPRPASTERA